ncbi:MAG: lipopolysaccharide heptosyltransferase-1 [Puniceicoccaceae bacterium 5H]|nr:MAG: lipopolysaccharide heptosyltransferase-1 [Puniceicoccaceae bacterium 5H]
MTLHLKKAPQRILIIRLSAIGDIIMASSVLPALRQQWPEAEVHWLTEELGAEILEEHPHLKKVWIWPRRQWKKWAQEHKYLTLLRETLRWRKALREQKFDLVLDLQGLLKSAAFAWISGARNRIGLRSREGSARLMTHVVPDNPDEPGPFCREYRNMVAALGIDPDLARVDVYPTAKARKEAELLLAGDGSKAPILLFPFTTRPQKHWFSERWAELAHWLAAGFERPIWILGGPNDLDAAEAIAAASNSPLVNVRAGWDSNLQEKIGVVSQAALAVGVDTGLTHLAVGLQVPTVVLFGSTCGYLRTDPALGIVLYDHLDCSPCRRHPTCDDRFDCMRAFSVSRVGKAAEDLWNRTQGPSGASKKQA